MKVETADFHMAIAKRQREEREAVKTFVQGAVRGDLELFSLGIQLVEEHCVWRRAFGAAAKHRLGGRRKSIYRKGQGRQRISE
jgi:hypothetical protein